MTSKQKALEFVDKFIWKVKFGGMTSTQLIDKSKQCALIAVDEIIKVLQELQENSHSDDFFTVENEILEQQEIKTEIEKL